MQKFEYKSSPSIGTNMNKMGADGWELAAIEGAVMHWKRPLEDDDAPKDEPSVHDRIHQTLQAMHDHMTGTSKTDPAMNQSTGIPQLNHMADSTNPGIGDSAQNNLAQRVAGPADAGGNKPMGSSQPVTGPADRPVGKTEPGPRPESTARTATTADAGSRGTAEAVPSGHTQPSD